VAGGLRFTDHSMRSVLGQVAALLKQTLPGRSEASVTLLTGDRPTTAVSTGEPAVALDEVQYGKGHGPCLTAARDGVVVEVADTRTDDRWPDYLQAAVQQGCLSSLSLPLPLHEAVSGGVDVHAREPEAFDEASREFAQRCTTYAAVVAGNMLVHESALDRARNLEAAIAWRAVIDRATGILMERFKLTPDQAFQALARVSMQTSTEVRDIAARFVETGEFEEGRFSARS
jgi:transcriptional regulator with GAF, ATPase, and Fis domain